MGGGYVTGESNLGVGFMSFKRQYAIVLVIKQGKHFHQIQVIFCF